MHGENVKALHILKEDEFQVLPPNVNYIKYGRPLLSAVNKMKAFILLKSRINHKHWLQVIKPL